MYTSMLHMYLLHPLFYKILNIIYINMSNKLYIYVLCLDLSLRFIYKVLINIYK